MLARRGYHRNATRAAPAETRRRNGADQVFSRLSHPVSHRATSAGGRETAAPLPPWVHRRGFRLAVCLQLRSTSRVYLVALNDNAAGEASIPGAGRLNHRDGRLHALHHRRAAHPVVDQGARRGECSLPSGHATPNSDDRRRPAVAVPRRSPVSHRRATHFIYSALSSNPTLGLDVSPSRKGGQQPSISDARAGTIGSAVEFMCVTKLTY